MERNGRDITNGDRHNNPIAARLPDDLRRQVEAIRLVEGISMTDLVVAGLRHEVQMRLQDPEYADRVRGTLAAQASELEARLAYHQAMLAEFSSGLPHSQPVIGRENL